MITYQSHGSFLSLQMLVSLNQGCTIQTDMQTRHPTHKIKFKERGVCVEHPCYYARSPHPGASHTFQSA